MGIADTLRARLRGDRIRVHVLLKGRIGDGWVDVDKTLRLAPGTTLGALVDTGDRHGVPLAHALANSPHLTDTLMLNGDRCPIEEHRGRELKDGDELYLLAPLAGG